MSKNTVVVGASTDPSRYAYMAAESLLRHGHTVYPIGLRKGKVAGLDILLLSDKPALKEIDTVTLYVGPQNQHAWTDYILSLNPKRIIFNPGTESDTLIDHAKEKGIECVIGCTLVMLSIGNY
jgi:predicted CoA-binding protein